MVRRSGSNYKEEAPSEATHCDSIHATAPGGYERADAELGAQPLLSWSRQRWGSPVVLRASFLFPGPTKGRRAAVGDEGPGGQRTRTERWGASRGAGEDGATGKAGSGFLPGREHRLREEGPFQDPRRGLGWRWAKV